MENRHRSASASQPSVHVAGFYQTDDFLAERVASFVTEGLTVGEQVIVLATAAHWTAISARLSESGLEFRRAVTEGRLLLLDATEVLDGLTVEGLVSVEGFRAALARLSHRASSNESTESSSLCLPTVEIWTQRSPSSLSATSSPTRFACRFCADTTPPDSNSFAGQRGRCGCDARSRRSMRTQRLRHSRLRRNGRCALAG